MFFLVTNCMVVLGQVAIDYTITLIHVYPELAPKTIYPSLRKAAKILLTDTSLLTGHSDFDAERIVGLQQAVTRLQKKSRSFTLASATFEGPLRVDLVRLYSFCRIADDLVDNARSREEADMWIGMLREFLDRTYEDGSESQRKRQSTQLPPSARHALIALPLDRLSRDPLYDLLHGFEVDLEFDDFDLDSPGYWPIERELDLLQYGYGVAGTVAELVLDLVFFYYGYSLDDGLKKQLKEAGNTMGKALQTVNIARDVQVDAEIGRVYIPTKWLEQAGLTPEDVIQDPKAPALLKLRKRLLTTAFTLYDEARPAIEKLPVEARSPMRVAVESYMEIGRILLNDDYLVKPGRATVPTWRRIKTALQALNA